MIWKKKKSNSFKVKKNQLSQDAVSSNTQATVPPIKVDKTVSIGYNTKETKLKVDFIFYFFLKPQNKLGQVN